MPKGGLVFAGNGSWGKSNGSKANPMKKPSSSSTGMGDFLGGDLTDFLKESGIGGLIGDRFGGGSGGRSVQSSSASSVSSNISPNITVINEGGTANPYTSGNPSSTANASPTSDISGPSGPAGFADAFGSFDKVTRGNPSPASTAQTGFDWKMLIPVAAGGAALFLLN